MKCFIIKKVTFYLGNDAIDSFHSTMFHGVALREGEEPHSGNVNELRSADSLKLFVNLYGLGDVLCPNIALVVSDMVRRIVDGVRGVTFLKANVVHAAVIKYQEFDFSHWNDPSYRDTGGSPQRILLSSENCLSRGAAELCYFEMICNDLFMLTQEAADVFYLDYSFPSIREDGAIPVTRRMLEEFEFLSFGDCFVVGESLFGKLLPFLNKHYYMWQEIYIE